MLIPFNVIVATLILFFVSCAMGQMVLFDLSRKTTRNVVLHRAVACLGLGSAGYGLFVSRIHFSDAGWIGLVVAIVGIVFVGSLMIKRKKKRQEQENKKTE